MARHRVHAVTGDVWETETSLRFTKSKSQVLTFRLSPAEYDAVVAACKAEGFPTIAAFTRQAMNDRIAKSRDERTLMGDLTTLASRLRELRDALISSLQKIDTVLGSSPKDAEDANQSERS